MFETTTRRRLLLGTGTAGAALLAGCTDDGDGENSGDSMEDESMDDDGMDDDGMDDDGMDENDSMDDDSMDETSTDDMDG